MDPVERYKELNQQMSGAKEALARAEGRRAAAEEQMAKVVEAIRERGFDSATALSERIKVLESELAERLDQIEMELKKT